MAKCHNGPLGPPTFLTARRRAADLAVLADGAEVDVLVVGGGVTGAGVALDAATRGLSVALIERRDLANGTSRWSSKLAHGGLRYLAKGQFGVAWESARERATLAKVTAPHLFRALPFLTPVWDRPRGAALEVGIRMGDAMRGLAGTSRRRLPPMRRVSAEEARRWAPALSDRGMRGAILHWDGQLEDDARLVVALARTAAAHGARVITYAEALELHAGGAHARDAMTGEDFEIRARHVINATGVWADTLAPGVRLRPSKGAHLLISAARLGDPRAAVNVPVPGSFGRFVFAVPRLDGLVMVGITDEPFAGELPDAPTVEAGEEAFLLETLSAALERPVGPEDVVGRYAGLRPLLAADGPTADLSRRHAVIEDHETGVVTVVGGKLTTYRRMAQDAVDRVSDRRCRTRAVALVGAPGVDGGVPPRLARRFGAEAPELTAARPDLLEPVAPGVPALRIELLAAVEREGALTVDDVLDRRTRLGLVPEWREATRPAAEAVLQELARV
jgi:glycerol-3-phosphate dehydrogenase